MKKEADLIKEFELFFYRTYGEKAMFYKLYETSYSGSGMPDMILNIPEINFTFFVEAKRATQLEKAISDLRPSQIARIIQLCNAEKVVFLLYNGGCARALFNKILIWDNIKDVNKFSSFSLQVERIRNDT